MDDFDKNAWVLEPRNIHTVTTEQQQQQSAQPHLYQKNSNYKNPYRKLLLDHIHGTSISFTININNPTQVS